jgi:hypothetical protein
MQDLNGNWTQDEPKVPKKAKLINLRAYNISANLSHKSKETAIKEM